MHGPFEVSKSARRSVISVEVLTGATVDVVLRDPARVSLGATVVWLTAQEVEGVQYGERAVANLDAEGRAQFPGVPPGAWEAAVVAREGEDECPLLWRRIDVPASGVVECELALAGATTVRGVVQSSRPIPTSAVVSLLPRGGGVSRAAFVREGRFEIAGVGPGAYLVSTNYWDELAGKTLFGFAELEVAPNEAAREVTLNPAPSR
ncbi:MAG: hypothetical protein R3F49_10685 [Planctomycetota bacterium]